MRHDGELGRVVACALALALVLPAGPLRAQTSLPKTPPLPPVLGAAPSPAQRPDPAPPPYEAQVERLAEIMGELAFLRDLCGDGDGGIWHDKMTALLDAERGSGVRTERLAGSYNRGFRGYQLSYRVCTPAARAVITRALDEGDRLAQDLSVRFGGD